jgi:hypothetical protein
MDITNNVISSWNFAGSRPVITGDPTKSRFEIRGFQVGDTKVMRAGLEPISMDAPDSASLVSRALAAFGTASPWTAVY